MTTIRIGVNRTYGDVEHDMPVVITLCGGDVVGIEPLTHERASTIWRGGSMAIRRQGNTLAAYDNEGRKICVE